MKRTTFPLVAALSFSVPALGQDTCPIPNAFTFEPNVLQEPVAADVDDQAIYVLGAAGDLMVRDRHTLAHRASLHLSGSFFGGMDVSNGYAVISTGLGLLIVDVHNPDQPMLVSTVPSPAYGVVIVDHDTAYVGGYRLASFDISDPAAPALLDVEAMPSTVSDMAFIPPAIYAACDEAGLQAIDVSDPTHMIRRQSFNFPPTASSNPMIPPIEQVAVVGDHLLIGYRPTNGSTAAIATLDISRPFVPVLTQTTDLQQRITGFAGDDRYGYVSVLNGGLSVYETSDPDHPTLLYTDLVYTYRSLWALGDLIVAFRNDAFLVWSRHVCFDADCPADLAEPYGHLDFFDVSAFLTAFAGGDLSADFADPVGELNFFDVSAFLSAYAQGCP